jgi:hypothetical protein
MTMLQIASENGILSSAAIGELVFDALGRELGEGAPDTYIEDFDDLSATAVVAEGAV